MPYTVIVNIALNTYLEQRYHFLKAFFLFYTLNHLLIWNTVRKTEVNHIIYSLHSTISQFYGVLLNYKPKKKRFYESPNNHHCRLPLCFV